MQYIQERHLVLRTIGKKGLNVFDLNSHICEIHSLDRYSRSVLRGEAEHPKHIMPSCHGKDK